MSNSNSGSSPIEFPLTRFSDVPVCAGAPYSVKGLIPREGLIIVWGPPKCLKSFWAFDLAMHVAMGRPYRGMRVQQGTVVYVACEGEAGLSLRCEAYRRSHRVPADVPFYIISRRFGLPARKKDLVKDIRAQVAETPTLIVIDTLNRTMEGSENDDEMMGRYIKACDHLREEFKCGVLVIHHCGIQGTRPRGHTSLTAAADTQIGIVRDADSKVATATVEFMKDGIEGTSFNFEASPVAIGTDADGDPLYSCVVVPVEEEVGGWTEPRRQMMTVLRAALCTHGEQRGEQRSTTKKAWREQYRASQPHKSSEAVRKAFERNLDWLSENGHVRVEGDFVFVAKPTGRDSATSYTNGVFRDDFLQPDPLWEDLQ